MNRKITYWFTNGIEEAKFELDDPDIPEGWYRGRRKLNQLEKDSRTQKYLKTMSSKSPEEKALSNQKRSQSLSNTYNLKSDVEKQNIIDKRKATMNSKSEEEKALYRKHLSDGSKGKNKGKEPWNKGLTKEIDKRVEKNAYNTSQTNIKKAQELKEIDPEYFTNWRSKINSIMKVNNTFNRSNPEERMYIDLCNQYGEDNVIRQYSDERYPFACDFYIPSEDLFIECNYSWTHGGHPFDEMNLDDISKLEYWEERSKDSKYYRNAIYTWTDLDVRKQKIAKENNLNYKVIY